jgi:hypothetical protein
MMRIGWGSKFDEDRLCRLIRTMTRQTKFYRVLKRELTAIGRWKNQARGKPERKNLTQGGE